MTTVINVPHSLDDSGFERVLDKLAPGPRAGGSLVAARHARWA